MLRVPGFLGYWGQGGLRVQKLAFPGASPQAPVKPLGWLALWPHAPPPGPSAGPGSLAAA